MNPQAQAFNTMSSNQHPITAQQHTIPTLSKDQFSSAKSFLSMANPAEHNTGGTLQTLRNGSANNQITHKALVLARKEEESMLSDELGAEIVFVTVGAEQVRFSVHKQLLFSVAPIFEEHFTGAADLTGRITMSNELPAVFRLFVNYAYTKQIPTVTVTMTSLQQSNRLRDLCQLFVFAEKFYLPHKFTNQVLDAIQDGFLLTGLLPDIGLVRAVYKHSYDYSKLRQFVSHCLVFGVRSDEFNCYDNVGLLLQENVEIMADFVSAVKVLEIPEKDPRVRDCGGEAGCTECAVGKVVPKRGYWPCAFHIHDVVRKSATGSSTTGTASVQDVGCYLWA